MERVGIIARLKPNAEQRAAELIATGPPFDPIESGFERHCVYLSASEIAFVFEADEVEWLVDALLDDPFHWLLGEAIESWRPLLDGPPRIAREVFHWERAGLRRRRARASTIRESPDPTRRGSTDAPPTARPDNWVDNVGKEGR